MNKYQVILLAALSISLSLNIYIYRQLNTKAHNSVGNGLDERKINSSLKISDVRVVTLFDYFKQGQRYAKEYLRGNIPSQAELSVVRVNVNYNKKNGSFQTDWGSGCLIKGGFVATAGHCLDALDTHSDAEIKVILTNGEVFSATVVMRKKISDVRTPDNDVGLLRINSSINLGLTFSQRTANGTIIIMGYPGRIGFDKDGEPQHDNATNNQSLYPVMMACKIKNIEDNYISLIAGSFPVGGISGGPAIDASGNIIGIQNAVSETGSAIFINIASLDSITEEIMK